MPSPSRINRALTSLERCGCRKLWDDLTDMSIEGKLCELVITRLRLCVAEQCWSEEDIEGISLTNHDRSLPYPEIVHRCLINKLTNAKDRKSQAYRAITDQRKLLEDKHRTCNAQWRRDLNTLSKVTNAKIRDRESVRRKQIIDEIKSLIRSSTWQSLVDTEKVCNLTNGQVSTTELELLSLGTDFKLENSDRSLLEVPVAFKRFESKYRGKSGKPDLHSDKVKYLSSIHKDKNKALP